MYERKNLLTTRNKKEVLVKFSESDTNSYPVDSRLQDDFLVETDGNTETEWGMETVDTLAMEPYVNKKTQTIIIRQTGFQSPLGNF